MGYHLVDEAFKRKLSGAEWQVLVAMSQRADDKTRLSWLARATIAEITGLTERAVTNAWRGLEASGHIVEVPPEEEPRENMKSRVWRILEVQESTDEENVVPVGGERRSRPEGNVVPVKGERRSPYTEEKRSSEEKRTSPSLRSRLVEETPAKINLGEYFIQAMEIPRGAVYGKKERVALNQAFKRLRDAHGLSDSEIGAVIDVYASRPDIWWRALHPAMDFARAKQLSESLDIWRSRVEYHAAPGVREEVTEHSVISYEEAREALRRKREAEAPSWEKKGQAQ